MMGYSDKQAAKSVYEECIYGKWHTGENVTYTVLEHSKRTVVEDKDNPFANMFKLSVTDEGKDIEIHVSNGDKTVTFTVRAYVPKRDSNNADIEIKEDLSDQRVPYIVCMHPVLPKDYILEQGCALIFMDTSMVAEDNALRKGCFYDLYPYTDDEASQTGELMAWGWAASKVLDAVYNGLDKTLGLNADLSMITGVSRWGKATAVCGAFEERFKVVIPVCSGAGGLAEWTYQSEGRSYDLSEYDCPADYVYGQNEPLSCLQSETERGWFVDRFLQYDNYEAIPVEQFMLPVLAADSNRYYYIVAAWTGEDWVNAPAMWATYEKAKKAYEDMGLGDNIRAYFHKEGHALLQEDIAYVFKHCGILNM